MMKSKAEIVIVGGGIIGLYTAFELTKLGVTDIVIFEKNYIGSGSTFRCGTGIRQQFGDEVNIQMMKRSVEKWVSLGEEMEFPKFKMAQTGYLFLLYDEDEVRRFKKNVQLQNSFGVPSKIITPEEAREIVPGLDISEVIAASWNPTDGKANPFLAVYGLARALRKRGVEIHEYTEVKDILVKDSQIEGVKTSRGEVKTNVVINATNAWAKILNEKLGVRIPIEPYKHQGIVSEPFKQGEIKPMVVSFKYGGAYLTQKANGGIIGGIALKYGPMWDLTPTYEFLREVSKNFTRIIPALKHISIIRQWGGYYAETPDHNAVIGRIKGVDGYYLAAGFSGHGFMLAPSVAEGMAELVVKGTTSKPFWFYDPYRFERGELREQAVQMG
ncbi:glycine/D-amino acid oxidase, deaminating [Aciduliprofundum sp. MAR08-339]|uniref:NAD(P)/FAD-dependent oxidoreductase n=1 Tax=Aciduliprofundum sp. (strain MAR08-339) TaxID=673860 RepID=UPI0002A4A9BC|nr:glycine/D-amino acid oxidase, deaminating [Aciduliprofundum sp. MAR08-339]